MGNLDALRDWRNAKAKATATLGWAPEVTVQHRCAEMVAEDLKAARQLALLRRHGHDVALSREAAR
jgi:GDPmannose 4,6-dehydratase